MTNGLYEAARQWAIAGYPVFPLVAGQKEPLTKNGFKDATTDSATIKGWWERWPNANIGIATEGLLVVDVDIKDGAAGLSSLAQLQQNYQPLPTTTTQTTASGGLHFIFECSDPDIKNRANLPVDGVDGETGLDIRAKGGYIVAAPSVINGIAYTCTATPPAPAPDWLVDLVARRNQTPPAATEPPPNRHQTATSSAREYAYADKALADECHNVATSGKGTRNDTLNRAAYAVGQLVGAGWLAYGSAFDALVASARTAGLPDTEARKTIISGLESGEASPRSPLPTLPIESPHQHTSSTHSSGATTAPTSAGTTTATQTTATATATATTSGPIHVPYAHHPVSSNAVPPIPSWGIIKHAIDTDEIGDAQLFAAMHGNRIAYDRDAALWYVWHGHTWGLIDDDSLALIITKHLTATYHAYAGWLNDQILKSTDEGEKETLAKRQKTAFGRIQSLYKRARINNLIGWARGLFGVDGAVWDAIPHLIGVQNGVIDLRDGTLVAGDPLHYIRKVAPTLWCGLDTPAPRWSGFIESLFTDEYAPIRDYIQRLFGYSIIGAVREHVLAMFWGETGSNGKGTMLETLAHVLGKQYAGPMPSELLMERAQASAGGAARPELMKLQGARLVWASETGKGRGFDSSQVKWLTGGDTITARGLYGRALTDWEPTHQLILITNYKPKADSDDEAFWRRVHLIPFTKRFYKPGDERGYAGEQPADLGLRNALRLESSGILAWLVRGAIAYQRGGLNEPECVRAATSEYRKDEDTIGLFIEDCCTINPSHHVGSSHLYAIYEQWCKDNGCKAYSNKNLSRMLQKRYEQKRTNKGIVWLGIGILATEYDDTPPPAQPDYEPSHPTPACRDNSNPTPDFSGSSSGSNQNSVGSVGKTTQIPHEDDISLFSESYPTLPTHPTLNEDKPATRGDKPEVYDPTLDSPTPSNPTPPQVIPQKRVVRDNGAATRYDDGKEQAARAALNAARFGSAYLSANSISDGDRKQALIKEIEALEAEYLASREAA